MFDPTSLHTLRATPNRSSANVWNDFAKLCCIEIFIAKSSLDHVTWDRPESVEGIKCTAVVAVQCTEKQCRFTTYMGSARSLSGF